MSRATEPQPPPREVDPAIVLRELANRWRGAASLEYRSEVVVSHAGEFRLDLRTHITLRRPSRARLVFRAKGFPEANRLRVCDGRQIFDRMSGRVGDTSRTITTSLARTGRITDNLSHPLDEAGYCVAQFFSPTPFVPPASFGGGDLGPSKTVARRRRQPPAGKNRAGREVFEIVFTRGNSRDTLTLDALSYAPLLLVRVGEHGGSVQELLRESFTEMRLNPLLPSALFRWSPADDAGYEGSSL